VLVLTAFFLGDSLFFGDFGDLAFGDSLFFFGDLVVFALAALAFLGDVASFLGLEVAGFLVAVEVEVEAFFVVVFLVTFLVDLVDFLGDLAVVVEDFFELDVDLFFGDDGAVVEVPEDCVVDVDVEAFLVVDFFFLSLFLAPGASLYDALTLTNKTPSFRFRAILTCLLSSSGSIL